MSNEKLKLGPLRRFALSIGFGILRSIVALIKDVLIRKFVMAQIAPLQDVVDVLTDRDPENIDQLEQVFETHKKTYSNESLDFVAGLIDRHIQDEAQKQAILGSIQALKQEIENL
jgi:predicted transcriptional regulator